MNKIILFSRPGLGLTAPELNDILDALAASGFDWYVNRPFARTLARELPAARLYDTVSSELAEGAVMLSYGGDGVLISTPTGSTAYSLSVGGPIVDPMCGCFVIAPIAPHNLTMRPVVIPDTARVTLCVNSRAPYTAASLDNRSFQIAAGATFTVCKAEKPVFLANLQNISFYDTLRNKMMWGLDGWENGR